MDTVVNIPAVVTANGRGTIIATNYGDVPVRTVCPQCHKPVMSQITPTIGLGIWLIALVLCLLPPLCIIPFFIKPLKDIQHKCPNCGNTLGIKKLVG